MSTISSAFGPEVGQAVQQVLVDRFVREVWDHARPETKQEFADATLTAAMNEVKYGRLPLYTRDQLVAKWVQEALEAAHPEFFDKVQKVVIDETVTHWEQFTLLIKQDLAKRGVMHMGRVADLLMTFVSKELRNLIEREWAKIMERGHQ